MSLPERLFSGFAPWLCTVDFVSCVPRWDTFRFPSIENFTVSNWSDHLPLIHPNHQVFHMSLANMPNLRNLELSGCMPFSVPSSSDDQPVVLPRLETLELLGSAKGCVRVFKRLSIPPNAFVNLYFVISSLGNTGISLDIEPVVQTLSHRLCERGNGPSQVRTLCVDICDCDWDFAFQIQAWETLSPEHQSDSKSPHLAPT
ncbi:hypothetical protein OF83DRAFT_1179615, partial [Amylostereum chailletii]